MPRIQFILHDGETRSVEVAGRLSLMQAATDNAIPGIVAECGGACACATCHVYIDPLHAGRVPAASFIEREMLDGVAAARRKESRLSCQIAVSAALDGMIVHIPDKQH
jgi:2Fe-2S ferredoxin